MGTTVHIHVVISCAAIVTGVISQYSSHISGAELSCYTAFSIHISVPLHTLLPLECFCVFKTSLFLTAPSPTAYPSLRNDFKLLVPCSLVIDTDALITSIGTYALRSKGRILTYLYLPTSYYLTNDDYYPGKNKTKAKLLPQAWGSSSLAQYRNQNFPDPATMHSKPTLSCPSHSQPEYLKTEQNKSVFPITKFHIR